MSIGASAVGRIDIGGEAGLTRIEGNSGTTTFTFTITRTGNPFQEVSVGWSLENLGGTQANDFPVDPVLGFRRLPSGTATFTENGPNSITVSFQVSGDLAYEYDDLFRINLTGLSGPGEDGYEIGASSADGAILADDFFALVYEDAGSTTPIARPRTNGELANFLSTADDGLFVDFIARTTTRVSYQVGGDDLTFDADTPTQGILFMKAGVTSLTLGGSGEFDVIGNSEDNLIRGNAGVNELNGLAGGDTLIGGAGDDIYFVDSGGAAGDIVVETAGGGVDTVLASVSYTLAAGAYVDILRTRSDIGVETIALSGNELNNTIVGNDGANALRGRGGHDNLTGLEGADAFVFDRAPVRSSYDHITDFEIGVDEIRLDRDVFDALPVGALQDSAFKNISLQAQDADDVILYKQANGGLYYDADGLGGGAAKLIAIVDNNAGLTAADILIIA